MDDQYAPYGSSNEGELAGRPRAALEKYEAAQLEKLAGNVRVERVTYPLRALWWWLTSLFRRKPAKTEEKRKARR